MIKVADRIQDTTTTTGTGTVTLAGMLILGYRTVASQYADGEELSYVIVAVDANGVPTGQWEDGTGTVGGGGTTLARTEPDQCSTGDTVPVNFAAGTKRVFVDDRASLSMQANSLDTQVLFNNAGVIGGSANFTYGVDSGVGGATALVVKGSTQSADGIISARSLYPSAPHNEEPFIEVRELVNGNQISMRVLGVDGGLGSPDLINYPETGMVWANTTNGLIIISSYAGPIRFVTGGLTFAAEFLRINDSGVLGIGPFPDYTTQDLGIYRASAGVFEINNGTAGTLRDLSARAAILSGTLKAAGYQSSDGSAGVTGGPWTSVTVKDGLVVSGS